MREICVALMRARSNSVVFKYNVIWYPITSLVIRVSVFLCTVKIGRCFLGASTRPLNFDRGNMQEIETSNLLETRKTDLCAHYTAGRLSGCIQRFRVLSTVYFGVYLFAFKMQLARLF